jgi:pimeloyl-ACP methyl ester carboxylesterase
VLLLSPPKIRSQRGTRGSYAPAMADEQLAVRRWGADSGVPLVLVHGFTGSSADFAGVAPELAERLPVVAVDLPGHGSSPGYDADRYTLNDTAASVLAALDAAGLLRFHLLGHSLGGKVAMVMATRSPERIESLVLMDTSAEPMTSVRAFFTEQAARVRDGGIAPLIEEADAAPLAGEELLFAAYEGEEGVRAHRRAQLLGLDPAALDGLGRVLTDHTSLAEQVGALRGIVTVLVGSDDTILRDDAVDLAAAIPGGRLVVLEGGGHSPQRSVPKLWLSAVHTHLDLAGVPDPPF